MTRTVAVVVVLAWGVTACSSDSSGGDTTVAVTTTIAATTSTSSTPPDPTTSTDASTSSTSTTEPAPVATDLRGDGIGDADFGDTDDSVLSLLTDALGGVETDEETIFTVAPTAINSEWTTPEQETGFIAPVARTVCFTSKVCLTFGGPTSDELSLTGWRQVEAGVPVVRTVQGIAVGDSLADHLDAITRATRSCSLEAYGSTDDEIRVRLVTSGELFGKYDDAGNWTEHEVDPANITVDSLHGGRGISNLLADCA